MSDVFASADQIALATYLANKGVERSLTHKLEDSRDGLFAKLVEILTAYKSSMTAAGAGASAQLAVSENLKSLPVLVLGLLKNVRSCYPPITLYPDEQSRLVSDKAHRSLLTSEHTHKSY